METLGVWLRQTREAKGSTLEQAEAATRIRPHFLEALEAGNFAVFPGGEVQVRGFLRIYARYLGLSPDEVLARYDTEIRSIETALTGRPTETPPASPTRSATKPAPFQPRSTAVSTSQPGAMNLRTLVIMGMAIVVLVAAIVVGAYLVIRNAGQETTTAVIATATVSSEARTSLTAVAMASLPSVTPTFPVIPQGGVTLTLEATEHVWARITVDGLMVFSGILAPEQVETWSGQETVAVDTGNGIGLLVTVNDQLQGTMCERAQVCTRAWGPTGEITVP